MADAPPVPHDGPTLGRTILRLIGRHDLDAAEAESAFTDIMEGRASPVQVSALLTALKVKGETSAEIAGGVRALRRAMIPVPVSDGADVVDTCGTGGGGVTTFNISTAAAFVAAAAGVRIAKHGNRSFSSRCGSADVLDAFGIPIELSPDQMAAVLEDAGIVFMFAPILHPAMRHVAPVRRELGAPTIMNVLGPLTNPASARRQIVGVADPAQLDLIGGALHQLGHLHALVVHGEIGLDELSPIGVTHIVEVRAGTIRRYALDAATFGWTDFDPADLAGGEPESNVRTIEDVLSGRNRTAARAAVALNAGAAVYVAGLADSLEAGVRTALDTLDAGGGIATIERLRDAARSAKNRAT